MTYVFFIHTTHYIVFQLPVTQAEAVRSSAQSRLRTKRVRLVRLDPFLVNVTIIRVH